MKITEQIEALETMGVNSASYLVAPKIIAALVINPVLYIFSVFIGIIGGLLTGLASGVVNFDDYIYGLHFSFTEANARPLHVWLRGLDPDALYRVESLDIHGCHCAPQAGLDLAMEGVGKTYSGSTLMHAGYTLPQLAGDYPSVQMYVKRV